MFDRAVFVALGLLLLLLGSLWFGFGIRLPGWAPVAIYLVLYAVASALLAGSGTRSRPGEGGSSSRVSAVGANGRAVSVEEWPTSGPIGRYGQKGLILAFHLTGMLSLLNPFQLVEIIRQGIGNARIRWRIREAPPLPDTYENRARYTLPVKRPDDRDLDWFVYNGGVTAADSHSWEVLTQRFAYDLVVVDDALRRHCGRGTRVDDYHCHGLPIVAAAAGRVVEVEQSIGTAPFLGRGVADFLARSFRGNYVVIEHAEDEFAVYAHLVAGSVPLTVGEEVRRGQLVGRCGHTGHSSEPHLHFHLQDRADFFTAAGLPIRFHEAVVDGDPVRSSYLRLGARVAPRAEAGRAQCPGDAIE